MRTLSAALAGLAGMLLLTTTALAEEPAEPPKDATIVLKLSNLTDATQPADIKKLETAVKKVKDVKAVVTNKMKGEIKVTHKAGADLVAIRKAVATSGFTIIDPKPAVDADNNNAAPTTHAPATPPPPPPSK